MKKLIVYLKDYRKECILAPLFKMLEALFDLFVPLVIAALIDQGISRHNTQSIVKMCLLLLLLAVIGLSCSVSAQFFAARASVGFAAKLRQVLFDHVQDLSYHRLDELGTNTLITRMTSDINQIQNGLNLALRLLLRSPFIVFGAMIMAFTVDAHAALAFAVAIPLLCIVVFGIMLISIPLYKKVQAGLDKVLGSTRDNLTGVRVIRAFCKEEREVEEFDTYNSCLTEVQKFAGRFSALMNPVTFIIINGATIALIYTGAARVNMGALSQGSVVALYNYMAQILVELVKLANLIITITKALACAQRVQNILDTQTDMSYPEKTADVTKEAVSAEVSADPERKEQDPCGVGVSFDHVSFTYSGASDASLSDISFEATPGETIGIIGGTGSGKTTLINLIPRFYDPSEGIVRIGGRDAAAYPKGALTDMIGLVPQKAVLFEGTIRENLKWGNENAGDAELEEALSIAQALEIVRAKEGGLSFKLEQNGRNLSGGQRQRLTIARALVKKPKILILDDSASALDFATEAALRGALSRSLSDTTVFIISQRAAGVRYADRILVLDDGQLVGNGSHDELLSSCAVYQEIYYSQFPEARKA